MTTISRDTLLSALGRLVLTAAHRRSYPIMACALFGDGRVTTTTLETFTTVTLPVAVPSFAVDARRLLGIIRAIDGEEVALEAHGLDLTVKGGRASYKLHGWNPADFPTVPTCGDYTAVDGAAADTVIDLAARLDTDRFGVQIAYGDGALSVAATDGYRALKHGDGVGGSEAPGTGGAPAVVVTGRGLRALAGMTVTGVGTDDNWAFFKDDATVVGVRRQGGNFPDVDAITKSARANATGTAHIDGKRLRDALARVQILAGDTMRVELALADGRLTLTAASDGAGTATDAVPYEGGAKLATAVNGRYLADFVRFAGEHVEITVNGSVGSPLLFTTDGVPDTDYVLMPMR